jgi:hypothetical protein
MKRELLFTIASMLIVLALVSSINAEYWQCFNKGVRINYCNPKTPDRIAPNDGYALCMSFYNITKECYNQGNWGTCNTLRQSCAGIGGNSSVDTEPPEMTVNSPLNNEAYSSRSVLVDIKLNEKGDIYYYDNLDGRGRWTRVCLDCYDYFRPRVFKEGLNDITFSASDLFGNEVNKTIKFRVDSKKPKINKVYPKSGFADGAFEVQFKEENPVLLKLHYGNYKNGFKEKTIDLINDCIAENEKQTCSTNVDLSNYDGEEIEYWFELRDVAQNLVESKHILLEVDITPPVLNNPSSFFKQGEGTDNRYIYFSLNITEDNFDEAFYTYIELGTEREKPLCSRLSDGICEKKESFRKGYHILNVQIADEAGNAISYPVIFEVL